MTKKEQKLLDKFAMKAMQSLIFSLYQNNLIVSPDECLEKASNISPNAYWFAEQMMKERQNRLNNKKTE